ncbi:hypothetical protein CDLVIII_0532 [Clostridium sp. DL-VIII]|uniref:hypothetical protein n=1 Tax=Clostridium sp. DL-VIII TaxID=641107 RepID=UPI00023AF4DF|nr:hypothetical protein [Clostridium sp. DL-VIII]EHI97267.1 hypothetical protein CDLVIII_0532 [Clostridium sp. DL-VIII]
MPKNKVLAEAIMLSGYCDIILGILQKHKQLSINKTLVFSYLIKKNKFNEKEIYSANNSKDILLKCISKLSGGFEDYCNSIEYIFKAIHLLIQNGDLLIEDDILNYNSKNNTTIYMENNFIAKSINVSGKMTDRQFLKEVIHNV